ncbi:hypothetical protein N8D56_05010 [Devosia sp. A8/3-2]|nr:hypothetical protein N8D56_05010 [Devosia sp. A8/3-2]
MAGLNSYNDLTNEIQQWLEREGEPALVDRIPTIIQMAESWLNRKLQGYQREVTGTLTTDTDGKVAMPPGATAIVSVDYAGRPYRFKLSGNTLTVSNGASRTFDVVYNSRLVPLSAGNQTNWLLQIAPDAYLYACLGQASVFLENVQMAAVYSSQAANILSEFNLQITAAQYGQRSLTPAVQVP